MYTFSSVTYVLRNFFYRAVSVWLDVTYIYVISLSLLIMVVEVPFILFFLSTFSLKTLKLPRYNIVFLMYPSLFSKGVYNIKIISRYVMKSLISFLRSQGYPVAQRQPTEISDGLFRFELI